MQNCVTSSFDPMYDFTDNINVRRQPGVLLRGAGLRSDESSKRFKTGA